MASATIYKAGGEVMGFEHYLSLLTKSIFIENIVLAYFLGMCSFLAISKQVETSIGLGKAVTFVLPLTAPANWLIHHYLLDDGALSWLGYSDIDLSYLNNIVFISTIAFYTQFKFLIKNNMLCSKELSLC